MQVGSSSRRPVGVTLIFIIYLSATAYSLSLSVMRLAGHPLGPEPPDAIYTWHDYALWHGVGLLKLLAAIQLFRLKRSAVTLFLVVLAFNLATLAYEILSRDVSLARLIGRFIALAFIMGVSAYVWWLGRRSILV